MKDLIKNIEHQSVQPLKDMVTIRPHEVASRTLSQNDYVSITLFGFDQGEEISTHASSGDALVYILEGSAKIAVNGKEYNVACGDYIVMSANLPHALYATEAFKMILTVVFPIKEGEL